MRSLQWTFQPHSGPPCNLAAMVRSNNTHAMHCCGLSCQWHRLLLDCLGQLALCAAAGDVTDVGTLFRSLAVSHYHKDPEQPHYSPKSCTERQARRSGHTSCYMCGINTLPPVDVLYMLPANTCVAALDICLRYNNNITLLRHTCLVSFYET